MKTPQTIVMIGPVYPYKGGISHFTGLMIRNLSEKYNVIPVSFKLQYPKLLYKKEQKDYQNKQFEINGTRYWINTANPFNWINCAKKIRSLSPDLIIFPWWHPYFAPCYIGLTMHLKKYKKIFMCHNVFPHERFPMDRFLTKQTLKQGDAYIVQSQTDYDDLMSIRNDAICIKTVHPTYNAFKLHDMSKAEGRSLLNIEATTPVLLFFGFVREYKGLKHLLRSMPLICKALPNVKLLVVGDFGSDKNQYMSIIEKEQIASSIDIYDGYIPDAEVERYFAASDLVVLPYESATQSGIVQIAYGFEKPVIATNVGGLPEVVLDDKTGYIVESKNHQQLADKIIQFFNENKAQEFHDNIVGEAYKYSWDRMREVVEKLWEQI
ncbi:MAG: glycosyltransferase [Lachnospiraceae bacterium]|nr:glycosyltransferase [Lachnospiraceae bacterium]